MSGNLIVLDGGAIHNLHASGGEAAWNLLLAGERQVVVSSVILEELVQAPGGLLAKFETWMAANGVQAVNFELPGLRDLDGNLIDNAGDQVLTALLNRSDNPAAVAALEAAGFDITGEFRLLSDDGAFIDSIRQQSFGGGAWNQQQLAGLGHADVPYYGAWEFLAERAANGDVSWDQLQTWKGNFQSSERLSSLRNKTTVNTRRVFDFIDQIPADTAWGKIQELLERLGLSEKGATTPEFSLRAGGIAAAGTILGKFGVVGDILAFSMTKALADDLRAAGRVSDANKVWTIYLFETSGGIAGAALGALAAGAILKGAGGIWGPIIGGVAGSVLGGLVGGELGAVAYDTAPEVFDNVLNTLYDGIDGLWVGDSINLEGDALRIFEAFGFTSGGEATALNDWLLATKWQMLSGNGGDDFLLGWAPEFAADGTVFDPVSQQLAAQAWAEYDAAIARGETPDEPTIDRDAGVAHGDLRMVLDGGTGDDWVIIGGGGEGAIAVGGEGSDLIFNSSYKGQLWGDGLDGKGVSFTGATNDDTFWWSAGSFIMDAGKNDRLQLFGFPLIGGTNLSWLGAALEKGTARDFLLPFITYGLTESSQLLVSFGVSSPESSESEEELLSHSMVVQGFENGDLGIEFSIFGGDDEISLFRALFQFIGDFADHVGRFAKNLLWLPSDDPLVLDLNGDGLVSRGVGAVYWDNDGDLFGERSGWLSGEDGFLVHDADGSGTIDATELFGGPGLSGYAELGEWDSNGDGIVSAEDIQFADLQIWRDANENGITDAGELHALAAFGITAFSLNAQATNITTANGTIIRAESFYAREDGSTGALGELIFETERGKTRYLGDDRVAGAERAPARNVPANDNDNSAWRDAAFNFGRAA